MGILNLSKLNSTFSSLFPLSLYVCLTYREKKKCFAHTLFFLCLFDCDFFQVQLVSGRDFTHSFATESISSLGLPWLVSSLLSIPCRSQLFESKELAHLLALSLSPFSSERSAAWLVLLDEYSSLPWHRHRPGINTLKPWLKKMAS